MLVLLASAMAACGGICAQIAASRSSRARTGLCLPPLPVRPAVAAPRLLVGGSSIVASRLSLTCPPQRLPPSGGGALLLPIRRRGQRVRAQSTERGQELLEGEKPEAAVNPAAAPEDEELWWRSKLIISGATVLGALSATAALVRTADSASLGAQLSDGFLSAFLLILLSEIGDKTFFIAMFLALRRPQTAVFTGTFGALAVMTVISVGIGRFFHTLDEALPFESGIPFDDYAAVALLIFFGVTTLRDAYNLPSDAKGEDEKEEAEEAVESLTSEGFVNVVLATFALVFAAEWGDKSFLATIALAAASSPIGVTTGAVAGHGLATGMAVVGGTILSRYISEKVLAYMGGVLFLGFAFVTLLELVAKSPLGAA